MPSRVYGMGLIFTSIMLIGLPGILYSNFQASGLAGSFNLTCPNAYQGDFTCQNSEAVACQNATYSSACSLSGTSISFLNDQSPFTDLITGNILGFYHALTNPGTNTAPQQNAFQIAGLGTAGLFPGTCQAYYQGNATADSSYVLRSCTAVNPQGNNLTFTQAPVLQPAPNFPNRNAQPFYSLGISNSTEWPKTASAYLQSDMCNLLVTYNTFTGAFDDSLYGCQYYATSNHVTSYWYFATNINASSGGWTVRTYGGTRTPAYCAAHFGLNQTQCAPFHVPVTVQPEAWDVYDCYPQDNQNFSGGTTFHQDLGPGTPPGTAHFYNPLVVGPITPQCAQLLQSVHNYDRTNTPQNSTLQLGAGLGWVISILLFIIASGINFNMTGDVLATGGGLGMGANRQATKFAQVLGLGLVAFLPLYSEFSVWFTSGILPNGFDGPAGIVSIMSIILFFFGVVWVATQD